jgi:chromosome segregation ATPase
MNKTALAIVAALSASIALADDFKTSDGKEYKNVTVRRVEPDGIVISSKSVIAKLYFPELPKEVQERFHYDAAKGDAYSAEQNAALEQARNQQEEAMRQKAEATERKNNAAAGELAARESANNQQKNVHALQARYSELQKQEDDLVRRIQEAEQLPKYLTGQSGRKYYSYLNPAWRYVPDWQKSLNDVRHEKDDVRKQIEQGQR